MKRYLKQRPLKDIKTLVEQKLWWINTEEYEKHGSDYIVIGWFNEKHRFGKVMYNTFNGNFIVYDQKNNIVANHLSDELDQEPWYQEILEMFYITEEVPNIINNPMGLNLQL